ncbi:CLUMA_CG001288, isoform A [Clunio marinus]|uniref:CLUMA_CG001288, isoform A n=1 Tax=Clunio marinus TaxID=568069 RepID=A0A1J1HHI4_9DIPT|nr:CLUMA_CG001288, isoform A [Clunio marinus]
MEKEKKKEKEKCTLSLMKSECFGADEDVVELSAEIFYKASSQCTINNIFCAPLDRKMLFKLKN